MASDLGMDMITKRPRTPRDPYTTLTNVQVKNLKKDPSAFFMPSRPEKPYPDSGWTRDRYARDMSEHFIRGVSKTHPYCYIDEQWQRNPPQQYDTCRLGASERWGPQKVGSRTVQHFNKAEDVNRFLITDVYRRPPTNLPGRIIMDHGRPHDGYYVQRKPNMTTWFGSTVPLNQTAILQTVPQKTTAEYAQIREREKETMQKSRGQLSEYVDRYSMQTKLDPIMNTRQRMKMYQAGTV